MRRTAEAAGLEASSFFALTWQQFNLWLPGPLFGNQIFRLRPLNLLTDDSPRESTEKVLVAQQQEICQYFDNLFPDVPSAVWYLKMMKKTGYNNNGPNLTGHGFTW